MISSHDWLTLHRVKFPEVVDGQGKPMPAPARADIWRFCPESPPVGADGNRLCASDAWGGFAQYSREEDAEAVFHDPRRHLPFLDSAVEAWHAVVIPFAHRGGVHWRETVQQDSAIRVAGADPRGPLVVMTSAGYTDPGPADRERMQAFMVGIDEVLAFYATLPGNLRRGIYTGGDVDGREGCTITLWRDDSAMMGSAYKTGTHKAMLDRHGASAMFDRSSFTRGRIIASKGAWDGANPVDELAA